MEKQIFKIVKDSIINLSDDELISLYNYWRDRNENKSSNEWIRHKDLISSEQHVPPHAYLHGVDLPYWFGESNSPIKIMIMGIDPLRNDKTFEEFKADKVKNVLIGTPYAVHSGKMRTGRTKEYWNFIDDLASKHFVYLTDIYKTFFYTDSSKKTRSYVYYRNAEVQHIARYIVAKEIQVVKPDIIITLGAETFRKFTGEKLPKKITGNIIDNIVYMEEFPDVPIIPMVHLSGATFQNVKNTFLKNNLENYTVEEKPSFGLRYAEIIEQYLQTQEEKLR